MVKVVVESYDPGFKSAEAMGDAYVACMKTAKELNNPSEGRSNTPPDKWGDRFDAMGCAFGGVSAAGGIMSAAKNAVLDQKLQIRIYNRSPYVVVPQSIWFSQPSVDGDGYRTIAFPGPLKPGESGEIDIDVDANISSTYYDNALTEVRFSVVALSGKCISGSVRWENQRGHYNKPHSSRFFDMDYGLTDEDFVYFKKVMINDQHGRNMHFQTITVPEDDGKLFPQFGVSAYTSPVALDKNVTTYINFDITPWEINYAAFLKGGGDPSVEEITFHGQGHGGSHKLGKKVWNQVMRENQGNDNSSRMGPSVVPFGNMASAGASMVTGLIQGARALSQNKKSNCPVNINVKNMTDCTFVLYHWREICNGHHDTSIIPAGEDGNFFLTDDMAAFQQPQVGFYVISPSEDKFRIVLHFENLYNFTLYKVEHYDKNGKLTSYDGKSTGKIHGNQNKWDITGTCFQLPSPSDSQILLACTSANHTTEMEATLTFVN